MALKHLFLTLLYSVEWFSVEAVSTLPKRTTPNLNSTTTATTTSIPAVTSSQGYYPETLTCDASSTATPVRCYYSFALVDFVYFLPTTVNLVAETVYLNWTNGTLTSYTRTANLTSTLSYLQTNLIPSAQTLGYGEYPGITAVEFFSGTTSVDMDGSTVVIPYSATGTETGLVSTAYLSLPDGYGTVTYDCVGTNDGKVTTVSSSTGFMLPALAEAISIPPNVITNTDWLGMTGLAGGIVEQSAPFIDSGIATMYPDAVWLSACSGDYEGYPEPKVVLNYLTTTVTGTSEAQSPTPSPSPSLSPISPSNTAAVSPTVTPNQGTAPKTSASNSQGSGGNGGNSQGGNPPLPSAVSEVQSSAGNPPSVSQAPLPGSSAIITLGGTTYTADRSGLNLGSTTLAYGASGVTINGEVVSVNSNGVVLSPVSTGIASYILNGLQGLQAGPGSATTIPFSRTAAVVTVGGVVVTELANGGVVVGSKTLTAGGSALTIAGQLVSVGTSGVIASGLSSSHRTSKSGSATGAVAFTGAGEVSSGLDGRVLWSISLFVGIVHFWKPGL